MRFGSVCSGIEAASVAWHPLGWRAAFVSEIEKFPSAVLAHHYPDVPNHGDMTKFKDWPDESIDLLVGGTPCQSFSVAGLRKGLADPRGNLMLTYLAIADRYRPRWVAWENVPGVLSSNGGRDFGSFLGGLAQLGYGFAYRVLDAQYLGVPQRRRRVFVVGYLGDWRRAAAVLFERHSLQGHSAPRREAGERVADSLTVGANQCSGFPGDFTDSVAPTISARTKGGGGLGTDFDCGLIAKCLNSHPNRSDGESETFIPSLLSITPSNSNTDYNARQNDHAQALTSAGNRPSARGGDLVAFSCKDHGADVGEISPTLRSMGHDGSHANAGGQVAVAFAGTAETMYGVSHADAAQTYPDQALRELRGAVGEEAYSEWCAGILAAFRTPEILRPAVHGGSFRRPTDKRHVLGDDTPSRQEVSGSRGMLALWQAGCDGCPPRGWQPPEQLAIELVAHLSELPRQRTSAARFLLGLWRSSEGLGLLREALSALQEAWRPAQGQSQPARLTSAVRRLTPRECERLMGFPDDYTLISYRGKPAADGPRYKALGNSMAVPVMAYIGERINQVDKGSE
jgi:DNA (cytosine-5)-methyltransferase 1